MTLEINNNDILVRRIFLESETKEIKDLHQNAPEFLCHYFDYAQWLDMALREVLLGKRIAYGIYKPIVKSNSHLKLKLVGTIILREEIYGKTVELKGLYVSKEYRGKGYGTELCNMVENYFSKRGYSIIRTTVPMTETGTLNFLLKRKYEPLVTKESTYKQGEKICQLQKVLSPLYGGDNFDLCNIISWLLEKVYGFTEIKIDSENLKITFSYKPIESAKIFLKRETYDVKGIFLIVNNSNPLDKNNLTCLINEVRGYNLVFIYAEEFTVEAKKECEKHGITIFDDASLRNNFSNFFADGLPQFTKKDIAGIVLSIHPEYLKRIHSKKSFTHIMGGPVGKYLLKNNNALFFSIPSSKCPNGGVKAIGNIVEINHDSPDEIWKISKKKNPIFTEDEYQTFVANKHEMLAITVNNIQPITPIDVNELSEIFGVRLDIETVNKMYINGTMLNRFKEKAKDLQFQSTSSRSKHPIQQSHLVDLLKNPLKNIYKKISTDREIINLLDQIQSVHPNFTSHGPDHSRNLITNIEKIIPKEDWIKLTQFEIFLLLSSTWIHDIGMADYDGEIDYNDPKDIKMKGQQFRKNHYNRSYKYITNQINYQRLGLDSPTAELIGIICEAHGKSYDLNKISNEWRPDYEDNDEIRAQFLAALFRLADACDMGWKRVKDVIMRIYKVSEDYIESIPHLKGAKLISGVFPDGKYLVVYSFAKPQNAQQEEWVNFLKENLEKDFQSVKSILQKKGKTIKIPYEKIRIESLEAK